MATVRKSERKKNPSLKAELNAKVEKKHEICRKNKEVEGELKPSLDEEGEESSLDEEELRHLDMDIVEKHPDTILPGREMQITLLIKLLTGGKLPPCLFLHGTSSTGKTLTVSTVLSRLELNHAFVNCRECYCSELLFSEIISQLADTSTQVDYSMKCNSVYRFLSLFKKLPCICFQKPVCIVLDNAEHLRNKPLVLSALKRLSELSDSNGICVMIISVIPVKIFFAKDPALDLLPIHFPQYSKEETLQIMLLDCPSHQPLPFFQTFVHHIWNVFGTVCCDLSELRHLSSSLFPKYLEPVEKGEIGYGETQHLWKHIEPYFRTVMSRIYLREIAFTDLDCVSPPSSSSLLELPFFSKYLLLASFLSSYNPIRTDRHFFSKMKQLKRRKSCKQKANSDHKLLGPKEFSMDRMMAIFYSIIPEPVTPIASLYTQVSTLVSLQLLAQTTKIEALDLPKYKCLMPLAIAQQLAKNVGFDLIHHLHDFNA